MRRAALKAYAAFFLLVGIVDLGNVWWEVQHRAAMGRPISIVEPVIWEGSSLLGFALFGPIVYVAARLAPPRPGGWLRFALVHAPASVLFSVLHILAMDLLRAAAYAAAGSHYDGRLFDFLYEYRKDIPAYVILAGLFWGFELFARRPSAGSKGGDATFDIKDGSHVIRARVADILALSSAGNYVEVLLADGRRPLMRSTLTAAAAELEPHGFVRTHRSWLVSAARVREWKAVGSGDFALCLDGGGEAPLSRRYRAALERLKT